MNQELPNPNANRKTEAQDTLRTKWLASFVRRWHSNPDLGHTVDPIVGHSGRVAIIINHLWPNCRKDLILAAVHHDLPEYLTGDVRSDTKRAHPALDVELAAVEAKVANDLGINFDISSGEQRMLKFADRLDAYWWAMHHKPQLAAQEDWLIAQFNLMDEASVLGVKVEI